MTGPLIDEPIATFLDQLASNTATPGGGSAAAVAGALGAALVSMVANLTIGKPKYAGVETEMIAMLAESEELRQSLASLVDADARAFEQVSAAMQMPRDTDQARQARTGALQSALKAAAAVPLQIAEACRQVMILTHQATAKGNPNVISDAGVAMLMAEAALRSAALNVLINLKWIKDEAFVADHRARLERLLAGAPELREELYTTILHSLN